MVPREPFLGQESRRSCRGSGLVSAGQEKGRRIERVVLPHICDRVKQTASGKAAACTGAQLGARDDPERWAAVEGRLKGRQYV